jgi:hypothetical protein
MQTRKGLAPPSFSGVPTETATIVIGCRVSAGRTSGARPRGRGRRDKSNRGRARERGSRRCRAVLTAVTFAGVGLARTETYRLGVASRTVPQSESGSSARVLADPTDVSLPGDRGEFPDGAVGEVRSPGDGDFAPVEQFERPFQLPTGVLVRRLIHEVLRTLRLQWGQCSVRSSPIFGDRSMRHTISDFPDPGRKPLVSGWSIDLSGVNCAHQHANRSVDCHARVLPEGAGISSARAMQETPGSASGPPNVAPATGPGVAGDLAVVTLVTRWRLIRRRPSICG